MVCHTWLKSDFTEQDPACCEVQLHLDVPAQALVKLQGHIASMLHNQVWHVGEVHGLTGEVTPSYTEVNFGVRKHLE